MKMDACLRVVCFGLLFICFRLSSAAPRIAKPTLRSGDFLATEALSRNGRSVEVQRWKVGGDQTRGIPVTTRPLVRLGTDSPPSVPNAGQPFTISKVGKRIWDTSSPTVENETHSISSVDKQAVPALRTGMSREMSGKIESTSSLPVIMRQVRLSSVSVDPKDAGLSSYPIIKTEYNDEKVLTINKATQKPSPASARSTIRPSLPTVSKEVRPTSLPQTTSPRSSELTLSVVKKVFPTTATSVVKVTRRPPATSAPKTIGSGSSGINILKPATILLVPDVDVQCPQGFKPDQDGDCREVFE